MGTDHYTPTSEDWEAWDFLSLRDDLTEWEEEFLESISRQERWSPKQHTTFDELFERKMSGGGRVR